MPSWETKARPSWESGNQQPPQDTTHRRPRSYQPPVIYVLPPYRYFPESIPTSTQFVATPPPPTAPVPPKDPPSPMGALRLDVEPKESLQIFVDGAFVGTPADLGDEFELAPGTRRIELRARGYRTLAFTAEIVDGRSITYRGSLERLPGTAPQAPPGPQAPQAPAAKVMYLIPGCYLGNVSPKNVALPPGCDISKLTTITP